MAIRSKMADFCVRLLAAYILLAAAVALSIAPASAAFYDPAALSSFLTSHPKPWPTNPTTVRSNMYDLDVQWISFPTDSGTGGGILVQDGIAIVFRAHGEVFWTDLQTKQGPYSTSLNVPVNLENLLQSGLAETENINTAWFRVAGAAVETLPSGGLRAHVTHHVYADGCFYLQVSSIDLAFRPETGLGPQSEWRRLFRPDPCLGVNDATGRPFAGNQAGGRIVELDKDHILVAYGDHEVDGKKGGPDYPQDPAIPYGKIWKLAKDGSSASIFSLGVRNQQGLLRDGQGRIWETEHGPQGGDELNLIAEGGNYGWPLQTYGVFYGHKSWPLSATQGDHSDTRYTAPVFAWVPSIAPTNLIEAPAPFSLWKDDLLLATLKDRSIHRLRIDNGRVAYDERIFIGRRIRDITGFDSGFVVLGDDGNVGVVTTSGPNLDAPSRPEVPSENAETTAANGEVAAESGETLFSQNCASCHVIDLTDDSQIGPPLGGILGRRIGGAPHFNYSAALRNANDSWTQQKLTAFVTRGEEAFPGTAMAPVDLPPALIEAIVSYIMEESDRWPRAETSDEMIRATSNAPFVLPIATDQEKPVGAYQELLPGFWVGFDETRKSVVHVRQKSDVPFDLVPRYHKYVVEAAFDDLKGSEWATIEHLTEKLNPATTSLVNVTLVAKLSEAAPVSVVLFVPQRQRKDLRIPLGEAELTTERSIHHLGATVDGDDLGDPNPDRSPRVVILLPLKNALVLELAAFDIHTSP
jgi:aldose sugar dehydrogenase